MKQVRNYGFIRLNDEQKKLVENNLGLVYYIINKHYRMNILDEDLQQEGMYALCYAAYKFNPEKGSFRSCAYTIVLNAIREELRRRLTESSRLPSISAYETYPDSCDENSTILNSLKDQNEYLYTDMHYFYSGLSDVDRKILNGLQNDKTKTDIGKELGVSRQVIYSRVKKLKRKLEECHE